MTEKNTSIRTKTRHPADFLTYIAIYVCAIISVALLLGIIIYVFDQTSEDARLSKMGGTLQ